MICAKNTIENIASKRTGSFIGILDTKMGDEDFKQIKNGYYETVS